MANGPKMLRITDIQDNRVEWKSVPRCECDAPERYLLSAGDIVIARTGATTGKSFLLGEVPEASVFASYLIRVQPGPSVIPAYLARYMQSPTYWAQITTVSKGTAQPGANASILGGLELPLAPIDEQRRLVAKLETLQSRSGRARVALDAVPPLLEKLRQSVLAAAFRGDLTADWRAQNPNTEPASDLLARIRTERRKKWEEAELAKLKAKGKAPTDDKWKAKYEEPNRLDASELPDLPDGWCWARWGEVGFAQNGRAFPSSEYATTGMKLLRPGNLHVAGHLEWTDENTRRMPAKWAEEFPDFVVGDAQLLMNLTAQSLKDEFLGRVCLSGEGERCLLNQRIARLTPITMPPEYWLWFFKSPSFRRYVDTLNTGSLIQHMFTSQVEAAAVPLMPLAEAKVLVTRIAAKLQALHQIGAVLAAQYDRLTELERSVLVKAFRGELVPQDPNDEPADVLLSRTTTALEAPKPSKTTRRKTQESRGARQEEA